MYFYKTAFIYIILHFLPFFHKVYAKRPDALAQRQEYRHRRPSTLSDVSILQIQKRAASSFSLHTVNARTALFIAIVGTVLQFFHKTDLRPPVYRDLKLPFIFCRFMSYSIISLFLLQ